MTICYDYMTVVLTGGQMFCVFNCPEYHEYKYTFSFGETHVSKTSVQTISVSRTPGESEVLFDRSKDVQEAA